jgi:mgtE-like transporter
MTYSMKTILKESLPIILIAGAISICAGVVLHNNSNLLFTLPGILAIIPSFNNMGGSITSVLCCRLSSALHMGMIRPKLRRTKTLERNIFATLIITVISFLALGLAAGGFNMLLGLKSIDILIFPFVTLVAGFITVAILITISIVFSYLSYSRGLDPDNMVIPLLTSIGDLVGVLLLFLMLTLVM